MLMEVVRSLHEKKDGEKKNLGSVHGMGWAFSEVYSGLAQLYIQRPYLAQA